MTKQELAQKRNYFKFVLVGLYKPIDKSVLTEYEIERWNTIMRIKNELLYNFDENSRQKGLNVPKYRCWCNRKADYETNGKDNLHYLCKKHYEELKYEYNLEIIKNLKYE